MVSQFKAKYTSRGKFGGHHISLYVEKNDKKIIESLLYPKQSTVKGQSFFFSPYCQVRQYQVIHISKNCQIGFLNIWKSCIFLVHISER